MTEGLRFRALSLWQPWASLWLSDRKVHETRDRETNVRGVVLVHAARRPPAIDRELIEEMERAGLREKALPLGALLGAVVLNGCWRIAAGAGDAPFPHGATHGLKPAHDADVTCGDWSMGRWAWRRADRFVRFATPVPYKGKQGFFYVPDDDLPREAARELMVLG